jgi:hypothetical protein
MKEFIKWDLLRPEDIEVRVGNKIKGSDNVAMLLYQDSRCTARNLDKQFGQFGWQIDYKVVGEQIYGTLSIWDETKGQWISKSDTGDKSNISEDKGQSSDILKRCAVRWGFGVELYTSPKIVIPDDGYGNSGYKVSEIEYNEDREITYLVIVNRFNKEVFRWDKGDVTPIVKTTPKQVINDESLEWTDDKTTIKDNRTLLTEFCASKKMEEGINKDELLRFYNYYSKKEFKGLMNVERLWSKWTEKAA